MLGEKTRGGSQVRALSLSNERQHDSITGVNGLEVVVSSIQSVRETSLMDGRQVRENELTIFVANYSESLAAFDIKLQQTFGLDNVTRTSLTDGQAFATAIGATSAAYFDGIVEAAVYKLITGAPKYIGGKSDIVDSPAGGEEYVRVNGQWQPSQKVVAAQGGYEFTGGFADRNTGTAGAGQLGDNVLYTSEMVTAKRWLRFGFSSAQQAVVDQPYWSSPNPAEAEGVGLFGGAYMPGGVNKLFDFDFNAASFNDANEDSLASLQYTAAEGSFDFTECKAGDLALIRFDFNVTPQIANTTMEVALIWQTRAADGTPTFIFPLTANPIFLGAGSVAQTFLSRPLLSAYFASDEDVNARALLAVRADNPIQIQPLTTLVTIQR